MLCTALKTAILDIYSVSYFSLGHFCRSAKSEEWSVARGRAVGDHAVHASRADLRLRQQRRDGARGCGGLKWVAHRWRRGPLRAGHWEDSGWSESANGHQRGSVLQAAFQHTTHVLHRSGQRSTSQVGTFPESMKLKIKQFTFEHNKITG